MSEEAVRQTRSQKRALEKDAPAASSEQSDTESDSKKPKMDDLEPENQSAQPNHDVSPALTDEQSPSRVEPEAAASGEEPALNRLLLPSVPTETTPPPKEDPEQTPTPIQTPIQTLIKTPIQTPIKTPIQTQTLTPIQTPTLTPIQTQIQTPTPAQNPTPTQIPTSQSVEPIPDNRTDQKDRASRVKAEPAVIVDPRSRLRPTEAKVSGGILAAGEVKATIKVEVQTAEPVDMSTSKGSSVKKEKRPPVNDDDDDDVIILSDNDSSSPPMNGLSHFKELDTDLLMKSSPEERERIIKQLKEELRLEEAKLVLLKKLRQSQIQKDTLQKPSGLSGSAAPPPLIRGTITGNKLSQQIATGRSSGTVIPPPLVRGGQQLSSKHGSQIIMPPLVRGAQPISVSPQQIQALRQQQQQQQQQHQHQLAASGGPGSGPPPLLLGTRISAPGSQGQRGMGQSGLVRVGNVGNTNLLVNMSQASSTNLKASSMTSQSGSSNMSVVNINDTPASRQAAAKLALRKQLEKTLLEIPPPKPPAPEFNFLPSAANNEFIYLVGLEEVVQNLLDTIHRGKTGVATSKLNPREPFTCTQCSTDFTCRWRQDKAKGGTILCEDCMSSNQKKALKAEHTNRLKAAFVKALQQEQEIEQRILQQSASPVSHSTSSTSSSSSSSPSMKADQLGAQQLKQVQARVSSMQHQHHHQHSRGQNIVHHHSSSIKQSPQGQLSRGTVSSMGVRGVPHSFSSSSQLQSAVAAAALVNRPGKHAHVSRPSAQSLKVSSRGISGRSSVSGHGASASASAWKKQSDSHTGVTMAYVNPSLSGHKTSSTVDARQREYLLDMIPSRSISQTANTWK